MVPVAVVEEAGPAAVYLGLSVAETGEQPPFAPQLYVSPHPRWRPPAGYAPPQAREGALLALPGAPEGDAAGAPGLASVSDWPRPAGRSPIPPLPARP